MPAPTASDLIDLVDAANQPVGVVTRGDARPRGVNFRTVHVLLVHENDRILLQRLSSGRERHAGS